MANNDQSNNDQNDPNIKSKDQVNREIDKVAEASFPGSDAPQWDSVRKHNDGGMALGGETQAARTNNTRQTLTVDGEVFGYYSLKKLAEKNGIDLDTIPYSHKILLENLLRREDGRIVKGEEINFLLKFDPAAQESIEIQYQPARVLLQDFTGVPVIADLASFRDAVKERGGDWRKVNPLQSVDLVVDHSVQVDVYGRDDAAQKNADLEFERNLERYEFLKWGQQAFSGLRVVPPSTGICHQINLEYLSEVVRVEKEEGFAEPLLIPDTVIGTDSHTPMVNGLGILAWGVGGIEAEAAMLGQPVSLLIPPVVGFELKGQLRPGVTATDLVLTVTQMLRAKMVVGKFVEYYGAGVKSLTIEDRATIGNMSPEYGATVGIFAPDQKTVDYLNATGRKKNALRVEAFAKAQGMWATGEGTHKARYQETLSLDLGTVEASLAGPSKPHQRLSLNQVAGSFQKFSNDRNAAQAAKGQPVSTKTKKLADGSIAIAAITSCTNTSNPRLMVAAALVAKKAAARGIRAKPWIKTSFAPGSKVVTEFLEQAGLMPELGKVGFNLVGYGCTTCIGNSGPLPPEVATAIETEGTVTASVLSGNRNFEARIHPQVLTNYLASPPLVVAYALAGNIQVAMGTDALATGSDGKPVTLADVWPTEEEITDVVKKYVTPAAFEKIYSTILDGDDHWKAINTRGGAAAFAWQDSSTYIQKPPFLENWLEEEAKQKEIRGARILGIFGDMITTDHISPAGNISGKSPAGQYLVGLGVEAKDFNSYGSRRGNHHIMVRGTFANVRIKNKMVDREGGLTVLQPEGTQTTIYEAAEAYRARKTPVVVFAGKEYGSGSSRDWAAKGTRLLGVRAVVAESFERIHRSNLVGMGVLPLQFPEGVTAETLGLKGDEEIDILNVDRVTPRTTVDVKIRGNGKEQTVTCKCRIDTENELAYFRAGGILLYVFNRIVGKAV